MTWQFFTESAIGGRAEQQDRIQIIDSPDGMSHLAVLADGLGGYRDGAKAAQIAIDVAKKRFQRDSIEDPKSFLTEVCMTCHKHIHALDRDSQSGPASTIVLLYLTGDEAYWMHIGDSRLYHLGDNSILFQTADHTVAEIQMSALIGMDDSVLGNGADDALDNRLYMCLGGQNDITPEYGASAVEVGEWFLICSDGFWSHISTREVLSALKRATPKQYASVTQLLVKLAVKRGGENADNTSLILAHRVNNAHTSLLARILRLIGL